MANRRIKRNWKTLRTTTIIQRMGVAANGLTHYAAVLTNPEPTAAEMTAGKGELETSYQASLTGGADERAARDQKRAEGIALLDACASYMEWKTDFNEELMLGLGFELVKVRQTIGPLPKIEEVQARATGIAGEVELKCPKIYGASSYVAQYAKVEGGNWTEVPVQSRTKFIIPDLDSRVDYKFRMAAIGAAGQAPWSNEIVAYAA